MLVAVAVGPLLDVRLALLVVPRAEFEAVIGVVQAHLLEVLGCGVGAAAELVDVVERGVRAIEQVDKHVLDADVAGLLDDAVDLLDDLLRGHDLAVALDLPVVFGVFAETRAHLHYADVAAGEVAVLFELLASTAGRAVDVAAE